MDIYEAPASKHQRLSLVPLNKRANPSDDDLVVTAGNLGDDIGGECGDRVSDHWQLVLRLENITQALLMPA